MPMTATKNAYTLVILEDDDTGLYNPREECDNLGTMMCWHRRYNLGDGHDYSEPRDFLQQLLYDECSSPDYEYGKPVYDFIKNGHSENARLAYNRSLREWELLENQHWSSNSDWYVSSSYPASQKGEAVPNWFLDECLSALKTSELMKLIEQTECAVILPLFLYDHSGITMNTSGFSCPWDAGQVGWIYASREDIKEEFGEVTPETLEKTKEILQSEVKEYDYYLTGQCYGFKLYQGAEEIDSCWGFLGELADIQKRISEELPDECGELASYLEYQYEPFDENSYEFECEEDFEMEG